LRQDAFDGEICQELVTTYYDWNAPINIQAPTENIEGAKQ